ncbi:MAG: outer membrane lipoprotein-sorting protein [Planctomycetes bacterium]|nr:outer membrane lipoprotein-sorting protein [Planctomycetota bacterium]
MAAPRRALFLMVLLVGMVGFATVSAQTPVVPKRGWIEARKGKDRPRNNPNPSPNPGATPKPEADKPAIPPAELRRAESLLKVFERRARSLQDERQHGKITLLHPSGRREVFAFQCLRRADKDGGQEFLLRHQRRGDLPRVAVLGQRAAKGPTMIWKHRPEARATEPVPPGTQRHLEGSALILEDFFDFDLGRGRVEYLGHAVVAGKPALLLGQKAADDEPNRRLWVRTDTRVIARVEEYAEDPEKPTRRLVLDDAVRVGVHLRPRRILIEDLARGMSVLVEIESHEINAGTAGISFGPEELKAALDIP